MRRVTGHFPVTVRFWSRALAKSQKHSSKYPTCTVAGPKPRYRAQMAFTPPSLKTVGRREAARGFESHPRRSVYGHVTRHESAA
jgi:hypothetical protein